LTDTVKQRITVCRSIVSTRGAPIIGR